MVLRARGSERRPVQERDRVYEIDGAESRALATIGAFRVIAESDLHDIRDDSQSSRRSQIVCVRHDGTGRIQGLVSRLDRCPAPCANYVLITSVRQAAVFKPMACSSASRSVTMR